VRFREILAQVRSESASDVRAATDRSPRKRDRPHQLDQLLHAWILRPTAALVLVGKGSVLTVSAARIERLQPFAAQFAHVDPGIIQAAAQRLLADSHVPL